VIGAILRFLGFLFSFTPIDEIPDIVKNAFISAEDKNFYNHQGFDLQGIVKAGVEFGMDRIQGGDKRARGASTIAQQVAKNFLLSGERTADRNVLRNCLQGRRPISPLCPSLRQIAIRYGIHRH